MKVKSRFILIVTAIFVTLVIYNLCTVNRFFSYEDTESIRPRFSMVNRLRNKHRHKQNQRERNHHTKMESTEDKIDLLFIIPGKPDDMERRSSIRNSWMSLFRYPTLFNSTLCFKCLKYRIDYKFILDGDDVPEFFFKDRQFCIDHINHFSIYQACIMSMATKRICSDNSQECRERRKFSKYLWLEEGLYKDILYVTNATGHFENLTGKMMKSYAAALEHYKGKVTFIFKTDPDTYIHLDRLIEKVEDFLKDFYFKHNTTRIPAMRGFSESDEEILKTTYAGAFFYGWPVPQDKNEAKIKGLSEYNKSPWDDSDYYTETGIAHYPFHSKGALYGIGVDFAKFFANPPLPLYTNMKGGDDVFIGAQLAHFQKSKLYLEVSIMGSLNDDLAFAEALYRSQFTHPEILNKPRLYLAEHYVDMYVMRSKFISLLIRSLVTLNRDIKNTLNHPIFHNNSIIDDAYWQSCKYDEFRAFPQPDRQQDAILHKRFHSSTNLFLFGDLSKFIKVFNFLMLNRTNSGLPGPYVWTLTPNMNHTNTQNETLPCYYCNHVESSHVANDAFCLFSED